MDIPVSLAVGSVRTPEFTVVKEAYVIMLQVEREKPHNSAKFQQTVCRMGLTTNSFDSAPCSSDDPLLRADWTAWDGDQAVAIGSSTLRAHARYENDHMYKFLGTFLAREAGRKYVVEVKFTHDGSPLNQSNPRLIVVRVKYH